MINEEQLRGINEGIEIGFQELGFDLTEREKQIIALTIRATSESIKKIYQY